MYPFRIPCLRWLAGRGCGMRKIFASRYRNQEAPPAVAVVCPERTSLYWTIRQPGSIESFEEAPILPKIAGYVEEWKADIGDHVRKGQLLATLWVPETAANLRQKEASVKRNEAQIVVTRAVLQAAEANVTKAESNLRLAQASVVRAESNVARWRPQYRRNTPLVRSQAISIVDFEITTNQYQTMTAAKAEAVASVSAAKSALAESKAQRDKSATDMHLPKLAYRWTKLTATLLPPSLIMLVSLLLSRALSPSDISGRSHFVQPPSAAPQEPLYVLHRRDLMRVFVDVPESDAVWVQEGASARVRIPVLQDREFAGNVRRQCVIL